MSNIIITPFNFSPFAIKQSSGIVPPPPLVNLLTNGEFTSFPGGPPIFPPTGWTKEGTGVTGQSPPGHVYITDTALFDTWLSQSGVLTVGVTYRYEFEVTDMTAGIAYIGHTGGSYKSVSGAGVYTGSFVAASTKFICGPIGGAGKSCTFNYIRVGI